MIKASFVALIIVGIILYIMQVINTLYSFNIRLIDFKSRKEFWIYMIPFYIPLIAFGKFCKNIYLNYKKLN